MTFLNPYLELRETEGNYEETANGTVNEGALIVDYLQSPNVELQGLSVVYDVTIIFLDGDEAEDEPLDISQRGVVQHPRAGQENEGDFIPSDGGTPRSERSPAGRSPRPRAISPSPRWSERGSFRTQRSRGSVSPGRASSDESPQFLTNDAGGQFRPSNSSRDNIG
jgi:hypothetical protein